MKFAVAAVLAAVAVAHVHVHVTHSETTVAGAGNIGFLSSQGAWAAHQRKQAAFRRRHMQLSRHRHHMIHRYFHAKHRMIHAHRQVHAWSKHHARTHRVMVHHTARSLRSNAKRNHYHRVMIKARGNYHAWIKITRSRLHRYIHSVRVTKAALHRYRHGRNHYTMWLHRYRHAIRLVKARNAQMHQFMARFRHAVAYRNKCNSLRIRWFKSRNSFHGLWKRAVHFQKHHSGRYHAALRVRASMLRKYRHYVSLYRRWAHIARVHHAAWIKARRHHNHVKKILHHKISAHHRAIHAHNHWRAKAIRAHVAVRKHVMSNMHFW
jgi:hypothetical protein